MIYTTGTIAVNGNTVTGTGTNFTAPGSLIRVGCTLIAMSTPVQVLQITSVDSATQLTITPAASPALPAGTRYSILLSDSLSVDGLAQSIAETFTMYQRYMSGFADVMNAAGDVTITINGQQVTVPGQNSLAKKGNNSDIKSLSGLTTALSIEQGGTGEKTAAAARTAFGLGTAATKDAGTNPGNVMSVGAFGLGGKVNAQPSWTGSQDETRFISVPQGGGSPFGNVDGGGLTFSIGTYGCQLMVPLAGNRIAMRSWSPSGFSSVTEFWSNGNTTVDGNGFLKRASPVVKIFGNGTAETNEESEGVVVSRTGPGEYLIVGCIGLNADAGWGGIDGGFEIPTDRNKQPRVWLDYSVNVDGSITVKTFHRTHPQAPEFAQNALEGVNDSDPIDIPADSFVSVRVEMPQNSIWNKKQTDIQKRMQNEILKQQENEEN